MMTAAPPVDPYAAIPLLYDLEHDPFDADVDLYVNFATAVGDPILELGCGTGRLMDPLLDAGFRVTGLDSSAAMLDRARARLAARREATLMEGTMQAADRAPGGPFGLVTIPLNGLLHLAAPAAQRAALEAAWRALDPRGQLVIDVMNATPEALRELTAGVQHEGSWTLGDGRVVDKLSARRLDAAAQRLDTTIWYDIHGLDGALTRVRTAFPLRYLYRAELELLLELAGFVDVQVYGGYELEPYTDQADRLIVTAEKTPAPGHAAQ